MVDHFLFGLFWIFLKIFMTKSFDKISRHCQLTCVRIEFIRRCSDFRSKWSIKQISDSMAKSVYPKHKTKSFETCESIKVFSNERVSKTEYFFLSRIKIFNEKNPLAWKKNWIFRFHLVSNCFDCCERSMLIDVGSVLKSPRFSDRIDNWMAMCGDSLVAHSCGIRVKFVLLAHRVKVIYSILAVCIVACIEMSNNTARKNFFCCKLHEYWF